MPALFFPTYFLLQQVPQWGFILKDTTGKHISSSCVTWRCSWQATHWCKQRPWLKWASFRSISLVQTRTESRQRRTLLLLLFLLLHLSVSVSIHHPCICVFWIPTSPRARLDQSNPPHVISSVVSPLEAVLVMMMMPGWRARSSLHPPDWLRKRSSDAFSLLESSSA